MGVVNWVKLLDTSLSGSLFGGLPVYIACESVDISGNNFVNVNPKTFQNTALTTSDEIQGINKYKTKQNRLKSNAVFTGINQMKIVLKAFWKPNLGFVWNNPFGLVEGEENSGDWKAVDFHFDSDDSDILQSDGTVWLMNPNRLMTIAQNPRTLYFYDSTVVNNLVNNSTNDDTNYLYTYYGTNGIPVMLETWSITKVQGTDVVEINMEFREDKELT